MLKLLAQPQIQPSINSPQLFNILHLPTTIGLNLFVLPSVWLYFPIRLCPAVGPRRAEHIETNVAADVAADVVPSRSATKLKPYSTQHFRLI